MAKLKKFSKTTIGFVTQKFERDSKGVARCVDQEFIAGNQIDYEDERDETIDPQDEIDFPFHMVQPEEKD